MTPGEEAPGDPAAPGSPGDAPEPGSGALEEGVLLRLWVQHREGQLERAAVLEEAAMALLAGDLPADLRGRAVGAAHALAGSLATFGLQEAGEAARSLERLLKDDQALGSVAPSSVAEKVLWIRAAMEGGPGPAEIPSTADAAAAEWAEAREATLLVVGPDREFAARMEALAPAHGLRTVAASSLDAAQRVLDGGEADIVLLDLDLATDPAAAYALLRHVAEGEDGPPVLALSSSHGLVDRVRAARWGCHRFVDRSAGAERALRAVAEVLAARRRKAFTVLAVDDDPETHALVGALLAGEEEISVTHVLDPLRFWQAMEGVNPDLVLLDVMMPNVDGLELCRVLRAHERYRLLPVVVLTGRTGEAAVEEVFAAGADDYCAKPVRRGELVGRIKAHLQRLELSRRLSETDQLTGLANRRKSEEEMVRYLKLAERHGETVSVAFLDIDHMKAVNDEHGHDAGDRVLRHLAFHLLRVFRGEDVVARWGGEEFAVAMYGMSKRDGVRRVQDVLDRLRGDPLVLEPGKELRVSFSAGVSAFPGDGDSVHGLYRAADEALYRVKEGGRGRVVAADALVEGERRT